MPVDMARENNNVAPPIVRRCALLTLPSHPISHLLHPAQVGRVRDLGLDLDESVARAVSLGLRARR